MELQLVNYYKYNLKNMNQLSKSKYSRGSVGLWILIIVVLVGGAGYYMYTTNASSTNTVDSDFVTNNDIDVVTDAAGDTNVAPVKQVQNSIVTKSSDSKIEFGNCDLSGVTEIDQDVSGQIVQSFVVSGGKILNKVNSYDSTSIVKSVLCADSVNDSYYEFDIATDGQWSKLGEAQIRMLKSKEDGQNVLTIEVRQQSTAQKDSVYISSKKILIARGIRKSYVTKVVPGKDLLISKTLEQIAKENPHLSIVNTWVLRQ
jgi:hypothetical protein